MHFRRGRFPAIAALAILGTVLGAALGLALGRVLLLKAAKAGLADYAQHLSRHADEMSEELRQVFQSYQSSAFCSDPELASLRAQTFQARDLKDIGRTRNSLLICSALLGRLPEPYREGMPDLTLEDGTRIYANVAVVLASASAGRATVLESGQVDVVLSPDAFNHWSRSGVGYLIALTDRKSGRSTPIAAGNWLGKPSGNLQPGFQIASGVLYRSQCSRDNPVCVTTAQKLDDIWAASKATQFAYAGMGGIAGFGLGVALALLYRRAEGLRHQLRRALRKNSPSLRTVYEPIFDGASGRCVGAEVLMRWNDHDGATISPEIFVRLAEESGFVGELTAWVLHRSTSELASYLKSHPDFTLSVNVAASDINGDALLALLDRTVIKAGIDPHQIALELTERSTADLEHVRQSIDQLTAYGFQVHVDDFGTGFSSLSYLDRLAVQAIKVDRCFTRTIGTDAVTVSILPQMLAMADSLGLDVVIEGVETSAQLHYLQSTRNPIRVQGWFFSRPVTVAELLHYIARWESEYAGETGIRPASEGSPVPAASLS